ncbi:hypothetical protein [Amycolatopsis sp. PS_44_ISF1]|uniref:hypothetical protein n=1 Tax=Amycolatopsis sp. PS_44_ISF1 TaxID=2974917 RepID=UPI0028DDB1E5|nr:hypothetical protein [Amycolatopsis sp. PS_44_ISF1]MDT8912283.1 hypothetical protein [Amycolatopsis sp. PS_44_ISF1]
MIAGPPAYFPPAGSAPLAARLRALLTAGVPVACGVYPGLADPGPASARHAEATHARARHVADRSVELPHFNTNPPPILRVLAAASLGRVDALSDTMADFPADLAGDLWRQVAGVVADPGGLEPAERAHASDLMLRLGYPRTAARVLGMAAPDPASHAFSRECAIAELAVLLRRRHDPAVLEARALDLARDRSHTARVRMIAANFVVVRNGRRGTDTPALHESAELALAAAEEWEADPFAGNLAWQTVHRATAYVPFLRGDADGTLRALDLAEARQKAAEAEVTDPLRELAWIDHAFPLYETIAKTHLRLGHAGPAVTATARLVELSPHDQRTWAVRGQALLAAGRPEDAAEAFGRALPLGGLPVARAAYHLAWIHDLLGDRERAAHYCALSRRVDPTVPASAELAERLSR